MNNIPQVWDFKGNMIWTITDSSGEPWFVGNEVANVLGYKDLAYAVRTHCKYAILLKGGEASTLTTSPYGIKIIPKTDVYNLILGSELPKAVEFKHWVTEEVLPSIDKTGQYAIDGRPNLNHFDVPQTFAEALEVMAKYVRQTEALEAEMAPKALVFDTHVAPADWIFTYQNNRTLDGVR